MTKRKWPAPAPLIRTTVNGGAAVMGRLLIRWIRVGHDVDQRQAVTVKNAIVVFMHYLYISLSK